MDLNSHDGILVYQKFFQHQAMPFISDKTSIRYMPHTTIKDEMTISLKFFFGTTTAN